MQMQYGIRLSLTVNGITPHNGETTPEVEVQGTPILLVDIHLTHPFLHDREVNQA